MTWLDLAVIVFFVVCMALGARLGSLWAGGCLIAGFFGAFLVDYYAIPLGGMLGSFAGATTLAGVILFGAGMTVVLLPAYLLTRVSSALFLGVINSAFGLLVGGFIGVLALALSLLVLVPQFPQVEKTPAWKKSRIVKRLHEKLEEQFNTPHFRPASAASKIKDETMENLAPRAEEVEEKIEEMAHDAKKRVSKEMKRAR